MKLIVAAIDFSPAASAAVRRAARIAAATGARLALLHVARHRSAWARMGNAILAKGTPHKAIAAFAHESGADLVVLGLRASFVQDLLGTGTAQRVRRSLAVPVLAVPREPRGPYRRILVTIDFSPASARGAMRAAAMFPDARIHLLHVCRPLFDGMLSMSGVSERAREEHRRRAVLQAVRQLSDFAARIGLGRACLDVRVGSAAAGIRERAAQIGADLLVIAPAERSWLEKMILFSVTDAVLSHADYDTLIVEPDEPAGAPELAGSRSY